MIRFKTLRMAAFLIAVLLFVPSAWGRSHNQALFKYVAGTESMPKGCTGKLEVTETDMVFLCAKQSLHVRFSAITQMEFQPRVSKKIRKMKLAWTIKPTSGHSRHQGFFSVLYSDHGQTHAVIFKVRDDTMRPYLAELNLKTGRTIESRRD